MILSKMLRSALGLGGYVLWKRKFLRFGIDPFLDVQRLSNFWGTKVDIVFDVGANDGGFVQGALLSLPEAEFHCFEPHPRTFQRLTDAVRNVRVRAHNLALGDKRGPAAFYEYASEGSDTLINSMVPDAPFALHGGFRHRPITVHCDTLESFCSEHEIDRIDVLKIDVEGFELQVLWGAESVLRQKKVGFIYLEYNDIAPLPNGTGGALAPIAEYLAKFGYRCVATYTDFVLPDLMIVANALFAVIPQKEPGLPERKLPRD